MTPEEENEMLKSLLVRTMVEAQKFSIWMLGHRRDNITISGVPAMSELPKDVQDEIIRTRKEKYNIE